MVIQKNVDLSDYEIIFKGTVLLIARFKQLTINWMNNYTFQIHTSQNCLQETNLSATEDIMFSPRLCIFFS